MICEKCKELGVTSKMFLSGGSVTRAGTNSYYDENGKYHYHNSNVSTTSFNCSNGHSGIIKSTNSSSCECIKGNKRYIYTIK